MIMQIVQDKILFTFPILHFVDTIIIYWLMPMATLFTSTSGLSYQIHLVKILDLKTHHSNSLMNL